MKPKLPPFFITIIALFCTGLSIDNLQASSPATMMRRMSESRYLQSGVSLGDRTAIMFAVTQATQLALAADYLEHGDLRACCKTLEELTRFSSGQNWYAAFMHETFNWLTKKMCDNCTFISACELLLARRSGDGVSEIASLLQSKNCAPVPHTIKLFSGLSAALDRWEWSENINIVRCMISDWMRCVRLSFVVDEEMTGCSDRRDSLAITPILVYTNDSASWSTPGRDGKTPGTGIMVRG